MTARYCPFTRALQATAWRSPFPPLSLAPEEKSQLIRTAESLVDATLDEYSAFLEPDQQPPDEDLWTLVRERESLKVYLSKTHGVGMPNNNTYELLVVGAVVGNFSDAMYGLLNHSTDAMHIKSAYMQDTFLEGAVLDTILSPTEEHPFRSTTVRWCAKAMPFHVRAMSKHRDSVYLDASGTRTLANGEVIGFQALQSTEFAQVPPLAKYERSHVSGCLLLRQVGSDRVQLVSRSFLLLEECILESATIKSVANAFISTMTVVPCAQYKKLAWLVQNRKTIEAVNSEDTDRGGCSVCGQMLCESRRNLKHACAVCTKPTCKSCRIKQDLMYMTAEKKVVEKRTRFCVACVSVANRLDAAMVARSESTSGDIPTLGWDRETCQSDSLTTSS